LKVEELLLKFEEYKSKFVESVKEFGEISKKARWILMKFGILTIKRILLKVEESPEDMKNLPKIVRKFKS
jgi:hypothetical protein